MKKALIVMLTLLVGSSSALWAQSKGEVLIGTVFGLNVNKSNVTSNGVKAEGDPNFTWGFAPGVYVFPANKARLGVQFMYTQAKNTVTNYDLMTWSFSVGPSFAYYIKLADKFHLTPEIGAFYIHATSIYDHVLTSTIDKMNGFGFSLIPAQFEFRPGKHFCMSANMFSITYRTLESKSVDSGTDRFVFDIGLNPTVGIGFYF